MLTVKLPLELEQRLEAVAKRLGRTKEDVAVEAIVEEIQDMEDGLIALERLESGESDWLSLKEVEGRLGLSTSGWPGDLSQSPIACT